MPGSRAVVWSLPPLAALVCAAVPEIAHSSEPSPSPEFSPAATTADARTAFTAESPPEGDVTFRDPLDPRLRFDLPVLEASPRDAGFAAPTILGLGGRRLAVSLAGLRVSSLLSAAHDEPFFSRFAAGPLRLVPAAGPDPGALRGDALAGTVTLRLPEPPADPYRPSSFVGGARLGFAGDAGAPAGHLRAGVQAGGFSATAALTGAVLGVAPGLAVDAERMGEALGGTATLDLRTAVTPDDAVRMILRLDGADGLVRGGTGLGAGFLRVDDVRGAIVAGLYRHGAPGPGAATAWALARTAERGLSAFDPAAGRWSRSDEALWVLAGGAALAFGRDWWTLDLAGELRAEGIGAAVSRGFVAERPGADDLLGDWPYRPALDGASRAGGSLAATAGFRLGRDIDLRAAVALAVYRLFLPLDPYGQELPERYAETERWEVEPTGDIGLAWRIGEGLGLDVRFESGARPPDVVELTSAGIDPAADLEWVPNYDLSPERSYGGRLGFRLDLGIVSLRAAYHAQWIDGAITAGPAEDPPGAGIFAATYRNTGEFVQGASVGGTVYLHRDWPMRFVLTASHGLVDDGWGGRYTQPDVAPLSALLEFAYRLPDGTLETGVYGGYRWRPGSWDLSPVDRRLEAACSLSTVACAWRERAPLGLFLRWAFWETLAVVVRAGGLSFQGDGPVVQGFLTGTL